MYYSVINLIYMFLGMDKKYICNSCINNVFKFVFVIFNFVFKILLKNFFLLIKKMIYCLFLISIYYIGYVSLKVLFNFIIRKYI